MRAPVHASVLAAPAPLRTGRDAPRLLRPPGLFGVFAIVVAVFLAVASAALSVYWAVGGGTLIDTMGGSTERWGRERGALAVVALVGWAVVKLAIALATVVATGVLGDRPPSRWVRVATWLAAAQLAVYGGLLTFGGMLVETGLVSPPDTADRHAITWHTRLWDPWTALWGVALAAALWSTRRVHRPSRSSAPATSGASAPSSLPRP
jgi:hypothetical protein